MGAISDREGGSFLTQRSDQRRGQFQRVLKLRYGWTDRWGRVSIRLKKFIPQLYCILIIIKDAV